MNPRIVSGMSRALFDSDLIATRLTLFIAEFLWATMIFWPGDTFTRPTYHDMSKVAPELVWGVVFGVTAILQLRIIIFDLCKTAFARWFAVWNAALWAAAIGLMLHSVQPPPAAIGGEMAMGIAALWIAVRPFILRRGAKKAGVHHAAVQ